MASFRSIIVISALALPACSDDGVPVTTDGSTDGDSSAEDTESASSASDSAVTTDSAGSDTASGGTSSDPSDPSDTGLSTSGTTDTATGTSGNGTATDGTGAADTGGTGTDTDAGTTGSTGAGSTGTGSTGSTGAGSTGTGSTGSSSGGANLAPNGAACSVDADCESNQCFDAGVLGGICGECNEDADCVDGGCTAPDVLADPTEGSVCNEGELGGGCETDAVCEAGLECALIADVTGVFVVNTCSECSEDADCAAGELCSHIADALVPDAYKACVAPGTIANDSACDYTGTGDQACSSGHCVAADLMGLVQVGVCGECEVDADCAAGETCSDPIIDDSGVFMGSTCV